MKPVVHVVKKGENLDKIARKHGYKKFEVIYKHKLNAAFRKKRPDPDLIVPGDKITVPPPDSAAAVVDRRSVKEIEQVLTRLKKIRSDTIADFKALRGDAARDYAEAKKVSDGVDLAGFLSTLGVGLAFKATAAYKSTHLAGKELVAHNRKFLKDFVVDKGIQDSQLIAQAFRDDIKETSAVGLWGKRAVTVVSGLMTPSFWTGAATGIAKGEWDPVKWANALKNIEKEAQSKIKDAEKSALKVLDAKIAKFEKAHKMAKALAKS